MTDKPTKPSCTLPNANSFQGLQPASLEEAHVVFLPIPCEGVGLGRRGTSAGPAAVLKASESLEHYEEDEGWSPLLHARFHIAPELRHETDITETAFHDQISKAANTLSRAYGPRLLIGLGGAHAIAPSLVSGACEGPATVVVLSAFAAMRNRFDGGGFAESCTSYRLREGGHRLILVGVRSLSEREADRLANDGDIATLGARDLRSADVYNGLMDALGRLEGEVWVSINCHAFDPASFPGVARPEPGGIDWTCAVDCLSAVFLAEKARVRGVDICEMIPDDTGASQMAAARLIQKTISFWGKAQKLDEKPIAGSLAGQPFA